MADMENTYNGKTSSTEPLSFFGEVLKKICEEYKPETLAEIFNALFPEIKDKDATGTDISFDAVDPFTFLAGLNSGSDDDRRHVCESVRRRFGINAQIPSRILLNAVSFHIHIMALLRPFPKYGHSLKSLLQAAAMK